jgi:signal transduction histidine kinase
MSFQNAFNLHRVPGCLKSRKRGRIMMYEFLGNNRDELATRCRQKVALRTGRLATEEQLKSGVPMFLDQLIRTLAIEQSPSPMDSRRISGHAGGGLTISEMGTAAAKHGKALLALGFSVDQVVHDYGDLCQAITDLAIERDAPFLVDEFRTLNRCLDNAIADAVTEFSYQRDFANADRQAIDINARLQYFVQELRNHVATISLAFVAVKSGNLSLAGATGTILERNICNLSQLINSPVLDLKEIGQHSIVLHSFSLSDFIDEVKSALEPDAIARGSGFKVSEVDTELAISGNREMLLSALANLLQNAFEFTHPGTEVSLSAYALSDRILIDVKDNCGGLLAGAAESMFLTFARDGKNGMDAGLRLTVSKQSVEASGGTLSVRDLPDEGCIFTINLPRYLVPT